MKVRYVRLCWGIGLSAVLCAPAAARPDQPAPSVPTQVLTVPTFEDGGKGTTRFRAANLNARQVTAWRDNTDRKDRSGLTPAPTAGYVLNSTVVIELSTAGVIPAVLAQSVAKAGATISSDPGIPGFITIDSPLATWTVARAAAFATSARGMAGVAGAYIDMRVPLQPRTLPSDPLFTNEWHLNNAANPLFDINAEPAWTAGYTGAGVVIGIVDQGWAITHQDLADAYNATASQTGGTFDSHATSCAGVAGARANNGVGVAGAAYDSQLSKLYYGSTTVNAAAFAFRNDLNHIKSNSWGPSDNAMISYLASNERTAITTAATTGRNGLGVVFVWAAGNGGARGDRVDYDPYASSRFTLAVGAVDHLDRRSVYSEPGSSLMAVAQSDEDLNRSNDVGIWTTIPSNGYTSTFGGTSAACPLAAGVAALVLQARPELTYRDLKHIFINTARQCSPADAGWTTNGAGRLVSYDFGFGAIDAGAATELATTWTLAPAEETQTSGVLSVAAPIPDNNITGLARSFTIPQDMMVEHVEVVLTIAHLFVGDLRIVLTSPSGTESVLALPRSDATDNYAGYIFTTVRHWDEHAQGQWTLRISDEAAGNSGTWTNWRLNIYGTPPRCAADFNRDGMLNSQDFFDFITAFFAATVDFNNDGLMNSQDFFDFCSAFFSGC